MGKLKSKYAKNIDDEIKKGSSEFMDSTWSALNQRLYGLEQVNERILNSPIDFKNSQGSITIETDPKKYPKNESVLEDKWRNCWPWGTRARNMTRGISTSTKATTPTKT